MNYYHVRYWNNIINESMIVAGDDMNTLLSVTKTIINKRYPENKFSWLISNVTII